MKINTIVFKLSAATAAQADVDARPQIAFAGRSNVGKSSLLNALANQRQLAKVSAQPGRTQMINLFLVNDSVYFADLPGYGYAKVPMKVKDEWGKQLEDYLAHEPRLAGVVAIFDLRRDLGPLDIQLLDWLNALGRPVLPVLTKCDKLKKNERIRQVQRWVAALEPYSPLKPIVFSAEDHTGKGELLVALDGLVDAARARWQAEKLDN